MASVVKRIVRKLHLYLGLLSGAAVFMVSITGALYVFIDELRPLVYSDRSIVGTKDKEEDRLPVGKLIEIASTVLRSKPIYMVIRNKPDATVEIQTWDENPDAFTYIAQYPGWETIYINPYNGRIVKHVRASGYEFFNLILGLHLTLGLNSAIGHPLVGTFVLLFVVILISGLILWWPKNKKRSKQRLRFRWKRTTSWRRKNYDLHNILGFYILLFTLIMAITGLVWAFSWVDEGIQWLANGGKKVEKTVANRNLCGESPPPNGHDLDELFSFMQANFPETKVYRLGFDNENGLLQYIDAKMHKHHSYNSIRFSIGTSGQMNAEPSYSEKNSGEKIRSLNYDIHTGAILGLPGKTLAFFASLVSASLPVTGFLIWYGRTFKNRKRRLADPTKRHAC